MACWIHTGSGSLPEALVPLVKAQLFAFLIYTTPALLQQQLQGAGQAPGQAQEGPEEDQVSDLEEKLPGPCHVLRRLVTFDPGTLSTNRIRIATKSPCSDVSSCDIIWPPSFA